MSRDAQGLCPHCGGGKHCPTCMGRGSIELLGNLFDCAICRGSGTCLPCGGTGHADFGRAEATSGARVIQTAPNRPEATKPITLELPAAATRSVPRPALGELWEP